MIEATMSTVIVGVMFVSVLNTVGATATGQYKLAEYDTALFLAQDLMAEILQKDYLDPGMVVDNMGRSADEAATGDRSLFNDVDDYAAWSESPKLTDGTDIPGMSDYVRQVQVKWVDPDDLSSVSLTSTGVKRVRVTVSRGNRKLVTLWAVRTETVNEPVANELVAVVAK
jgi:hypothetical protein